MLPGLEYYFRHAELREYCEAVSVKTPGILSIFAAALPLLACLAQTQAQAQAQQSDGEQAVLDRLAGGWRLVWMDFFDEDGEAVRQPYSVGRIHYTADGLMAEQLMPDGWRDDAGADYYAYFGTVSVDLARQAVVHHVQGAYNRVFLDQSMPRYFEFSENDTVLMLEARENNRTTVRARLERITPETKAQAPR